MDKACVGRHQILFSAYAEVFQTPVYAWVSGQTFLCLRRGVSGTPSLMTGDHSFSLPTQRCFPHRSRRKEKPRLFSAYAEVFLSEEKKRLTKNAFLCLRRGVSSSCCCLQRDNGFSLPTQRCFLDAALAEEAADAFLCLRRGVSHLYQTYTLSPPLFSAYAEVFLVGPVDGLKSVSFLCLRRGVSHCFDAVAYAAGFSLPTQRCFSGSGHRVRGRSSFLCLRRGVSSPKVDQRIEEHFSLPTQRCFHAAGRLRAER